MSADATKALVPAVLVGLAVGVFSGLLGVGGGIIMVPMLVGLIHLSQHEAHATSLAAIIPIATVGALTFAVAGEIDFPVAGLLTLGALAGAPLGARIMARTSEGLLKTLFGLLMTGVGVQLLLA